MPRRKRCSGCGLLTDPARLERVGGREPLCPECLLLEAERIGEAAPADVSEEHANHESRITNRDPWLEDADAGLAKGIGPDEWDVAPDPPEPLPLRDDEERFAGLVERAVEGWPLTRGRLSASALATFLRCPEQFRRQYVLGERTPDGGSALAGTGAHGAIEAALRLRIDRGLVASPKQIADTFDAVYDAAVAKARDRGAGINWGTYTVGKVKHPMTEDVGRALGRAAVTAYADEHLETLDGVDVEHVFVFDVPGVAVPICGLIDVLGERSTTDLKFGAQTSAVVKPDWRIQALVYGFASRLPVDFHATSWAGKAQTQRTHPGLRFGWDAGTAIVAARVIRSVVEAILLYADRWPSSPWPGNVTHTWACGSCDFRPECPWWNVGAGALLV